MVCPKCGARLSSSSRFCNNCGARIEEKAPFKIERHDEEYSDIYSSSRRGETVSSSTGSRRAPAKRKKKKSTGKKVAIVLCSILAVVLAAVICIISFGLSSLDKINRTDLADDLGISDTAESDSRVRNILLYGLDSRKDDFSGRSDAIILLSIDKKHNKIKMTSVARDSYVDIEGHNKDKLTHAWAYGKADLAVKTFNSNFGTDVTDFVAINFYQFASVIDYVGGVEVDVSEAEKKVMNRNYIPNLQAMGIKCEKVTDTGLQLLSGGQALAYTRNRYTGGDIERGNRQKEVLSALMNKIKTISVSKYPDIINMMTANCQTSLDNNDILSLGSWAVLKKPEIETLSLPNEPCNAKGKIIKRVWYYVYDLEAAKNEIVNFVYNDISPEKDEGK